MKYIQKFLLSLALLCTHNPSVFASTLHKLLKKNEIEKIKDFLNKNKKDIINTQDELGETPLYWACYWGHLDIITLLIGNGADVNIPDKNKKTPLYQACFFNFLDIAKLLIKSGADVNLANKKKETPLFEACYAGKLDVATLLLEKGAGVNIANKNGETPLYKACFSGHLNIIKLLLKNGADATLKAKNNESPLSLIYSRRWTTERRKNLLMSLIPTNPTLSQNAKDFIKKVIATLEKEMQKNPTVAPQVPQNDGLFKSPLIKNPEQEIARIEELVKILLFEPRQKVYTWPNKTTCLNKFDMVCPTHFNHSPAEFRLKINFGINYKQYFFLRMLQDMAHEAIKQPKTITCSSSSASSKTNRYSKLIDIIIKCYKSSSTESSVSFEDMTDQNIENNK